MSRRREGAALEVGGGSAGRARPRGRASRALPRPCCARCRTCCCKCLEQQQHQHIEIKDSCGRERECSLDSISAASVYSSFLGNSQMERHCYSGIWAVVEVPFNRADALSTIMPCSAAYASSRKSRPAVPGHKVNNHVAVGTQGTPSATSQCLHHRSFKIKASWDS